MNSVQNLFKYIVFCIVIPKNLFMSFKNLKTDISTVLSNSQLNTLEKLSTICELLQTSVPNYDWVGFYFANHNEKTLHLKAFSGEPTEHTVIPFGKGICGQVAVSNSNFVVPDVLAQNNYISCGINVKSEIVIPLFVDEINVGQIDIDSHNIDAFNSKDEDFLEWINEEVSKELELDSNRNVKFV